ncbi:MAG: protein kinase domain-containing protein, partial [Alphaproteobacteria bacterium]
MASEPTSAPTKGQDTGKGQDAGKGQAPVEAAPKPAPAPVRNRSGGVALKERYHIYPNSPLVALDMPSARAYAVEDKKSNDQLYALICQPDMPVRINEMRSLRGVKATGLLPLIEFGPITWPETGKTHMAVVYAEPLGGRVRADVKARISPIHEREVGAQLIEPITAAIKELHSRRVMHRAIRPDNLYYLDPAKQQLVLGDCVTSPPAYDQPSLCENIVSSMTQRDARGEGSSQNDLYAFGVLIIAMLTGRVPCLDLSDEELLHDKITQGSYQAVVGELRLPLPITEVLRGLLSDDPNHRWDIEALELWHAGRRLSPIQSK